MTQGSEDLWEKFLTYRLKDKVTLAEDIARLPQGDTFIFLGQDHTGLCLFEAAHETSKRTVPAARGDDGQWIRATDNDVSKYGN
ncbi:MAG: hypothetical protein NXI09_11690 [Bacteroidetes bacterium]|nr:hypothetical protein [Bacteroidota bacterium]